MGDVKADLKVPPDGGWGWVVTFGAFLAYFLADGWAYSFGIFFTPFLINFQEGKGRTAIIAALQYGIPLLISPLVCALTSTYGCRVVAICGGLVSGFAFVISYFATSVSYLCVTLGVICSFGLAMTYIPAIVIVTNYFEKRRGLATALAVTGSGLGAFAFPPLLEYLIEHYGWRGALLIMGAIYLNVCLAGALFRPPPKIYSATCYADKNTTELLSEEKRINAEENGATSDSRNKESEDNNSSKSACDRLSSELLTLCRSMLDKSLALNTQYLLYCASAFIFYLWCGIPYVYLVDKATLYNIPFERGTFLLSIIGIGRTAGQLIIGFLGDIPQLDTILLYTVCILICGLDTLFVPLMKTFLSLSFFSGIYGFFISATYCLQMMCVVEITGLEKSTNAFGLFQLVQGIATLLGTAIPGWLFDKTQTYTLSFYISGGLMIFSGFMLLPVPYLLKRSKNDVPPSR